MHHPRQHPHHLALGARKLRDLSAEDIDRWLADKAKTLSTRTLREVRSVLKRSITRAQARDKVKRNVVLLVEDIPKGQEGRPSKSLTIDQEGLVAVTKAGLFERIRRDSWREGLSVRALARR